VDVINKVREGFKKRKKSELAAGASGLTQGIEKVG
jgi:hypothetical protein